MADTIDRVLLTSKTTEDQNARTAFRKLDTRVHLCTTQVQKLLIESMSKTQDYNFSPEERQKLVAMSDMVMEMADTAMEAKDSSKP